MLNLCNQLQDIMIKFKNFRFDSPKNKDKKRPNESHYVNFYDVPSKKLKLSKSKENQRNIKQVKRKSSVVAHYNNLCDENLIL